MVYPETVASTRQSAVILWIHGSGHILRRLQLSPSDPKDDTKEYLLEEQAHTDQIASALSLSQDSHVRECYTILKQS